MILKPEYEGLVNLEYARIKIQEVLMEQGFKWSQTASKVKVAKLSFQLPTSEDKINTKEQQEFVERYIVHNDLMSLIREKRDSIQNVNIDLAMSYEYQEYKLSDLFDIEKGKSKYTKKYGNEHKGSYPVYSASNNAPLTQIDTYDYDGDYLTWATNGFAGYFKQLNQKFSINGDRALLKPKHDNIDIKYFKFILEPIFRNMAKGRKGEGGEDEFTKVYPSMVSDLMIKVPIDSEGTISKDKQTEIAQKYITIEEIKREIDEKLVELQSVHVDFE